MVSEAAKNGAQVVALPEMWNCPYANEYFRPYAEPEDGPSVEFLSNLARELDIYLIGGSISELSDNKVYNTSYSFDRSGNLIGKHRKVHLFDIAVKNGIRFMESETLSPGDKSTVIDTEYCKIGVAICYDVRFPELSRKMALEGAKLIVLPAAFNMTTGPAHWELLFRQRAVDNQCFTVGVSPARDEQGSYVAYGNSIAVDPWGAVLCRAGAEETTLYADLDMERLEAVRAQLPILSARRTDLYEVREK